MDIHTIGCTIEPLSLDIFKKLCWYGKFVFIIVLSLQSVRQNEDAPCYARPIHRKGALALGQFQLARSFHTLLDTLNHFLPLPVVYVVNRSRITWFVFILTNRSQRQNYNKNKFFISTYTFEYTKQRGAQLCIRWYIDPYRWHGQFKTHWA